MAKTPQRLSVADLVAYLKKNAPPGISQPQVNQHIRNYNLKMDAHHRVDVAEFLDAMAKAHAQDTRLQGPSTDPKDPKRQKLVLQCMKLKLEYDKARGLLIEVDVIGQQVMEIMADLKGVLLPMAGALGPMLEGKTAVEISGVLRDKMEGALRKAGERLKEKGAV